MSLNQHTDLFGLVFSIGLEPRASLSLNYIPTLPHCFKQQFFSFTEFRSAQNHQNL